MQTRLGSFYEACISTVVGFAVTFTAGPFIYPIFGVTVSMKQNLGVVACFTVLSVLRGYVIRRWFNERIKRAAERMAKATKG